MFTKTELTFIFCFTNLSDLEFKFISNKNKFNTVIYLLAQLGGKFAQTNTPSTAPACVPAGLSECLKVPG